MRPPVGLSLWRRVHPGPAGESERRTPAIALLALLVLGGAFPAAAALAHAAAPGGPLRSPSALTGAAALAPAARPAHVVPAASVTPVWGATLLANIAFGLVNGSGPQPAGASVDTGNGYLYVPDFGSNNVTIIDGATNKIVAEPGSGDDPIESVYDPTDGYVYVADFGSTHDISVYSGTTEIGTVSTGGASIALTYDPGNGLVYAMVYGNRSVAAISGLTLVALIPVGSYPQAAAYDPTTKDLYVTNTGSDNVTIISGTTNTIVANVPVGTAPAGVVYDAANGYVYVSNSGGSNLSVLGGTVARGSVNVGSAPAFPAYDPTKQYVYVGCEGTQTLAIVNGTTLVANLSVGITPRTSTYSPTTGEVYVTNEASDNVSVVNGTTVVASVSGGNAPWGGVYDSANGETYISEYTSGNVSAIGGVAKTYYVTFDEKGLSPGVPWGAALGATLYPTNTTSVEMYAVNGAYNYSVPFVPGYAQVPPGRVNVSANFPVVTITFVRTYPVTLNESGLPPGLDWGATVGAVTETGVGNLTFQETNGTFAYQVLPVAGYQTTWKGNFTVNAGSVTVFVIFSEYLLPVSFVASGLAPSIPWSVDFRGVLSSGTGTVIGFQAPNGTFLYRVPRVPGYVGPSGGTTNVSGAPDTVNLVFTQYDFTIDFVETGLPTGTNWSVAIGGQSPYATGTSILVPEPNGSFSYTIAPVGRLLATPSSGTIVVNNGSPTVDVHFAPPAGPPENYTVSFIESGLPPGRAWSIAWNGSTPRSSANSSINYHVPNGTYPYTVGGVAGYQTNWSGLVHVSGGAIGVKVPFAQFRYAVTFVESGLATGVTWSISLSGVASLSSTGASIVFEEPNGTYDYSVGYIAGYAAAGSGSVTVSGSAPQTVGIAFGPPASATAFAIPLPVAVGLVAAVVVVATLALFLRRRSRSGPASRSPDPAPVEPPTTESVEEP